MNISRRTTLASLAAIMALPVGSWAKEPLIAVDVVKIMSFSCSVCLASEAHDSAITLAVTATGGRFIRAPLPSLENDTGAAHRLYYAARDMSPGLGERVKRSLYKGTQEAEVSLYDAMQVYTWITQDLSGDETSFTELFKRAQDISSEQALARAARLALNAGVQLLPSYILLVKNDIRSVLDTSSSVGGSLPALRSNVVSTIQTLSHPNANSPTP